MGIIFRITIAECFTLAPRTLANSVTLAMLWLHSNPCQCKQLYPKPYVFDDEETEKNVCIISPD